ncbi:hypothetical protein FZ351_23300, partial [Salmonella enterica]|nr:hypothetical protein [Salmonella enterica]
MSTPCERLGYEEGMQFTLVNDDVDGLSAGDTVWLHDDDGSNNPKFRDTEKEHDDTETFYIDLRCVARYSSDHTLAYMRGFREGDILQVVMYDAAEGAKEGDIVTFINDDRDTCPEFRLHKNDSEPYLYLSHVGSLEPKLGRKVRIIHNCTGGFSSGTEGIIVDICSDGDYQIEAYGDTMYHHSSSCIVYGYAEDESSEKGSEPVKEEYPTKPASEWTKGDKGIVRGQQEIDPHNFQIGEVIIFSHRRDSERGIFTGTRYTSTQNIQYDLIEVITGIEPYQITVTKVSKDNPVAC